MITKARRRKKTTIGLGLRCMLIALAVLLIGAVVLFFGINHWSVTMKMHGADRVTLEYGSSYQEEGAEAYFSGSLFCRKGFPIKVTNTGEIDIGKVGEYHISYSARVFLYSALQTRTVIVEDTESPVIKLVEKPDSYTLPGTAYQEEGYTATDNYDGDLTDQVKRKEKDGVVYYTVEDSSGNKTSVTRKINYEDLLPPDLQLKGEETLTISAGSTYEEPGWTAEDNFDGDLKDDVTVKGTVDTYKAGTYTLNYSVTDKAGNTATAKRTVKVEPIRQPDTVTPDGKVIYLTFDDGPSSHTKRLLKTLDTYNVKATFFVVNTGYTSLISKEVEAGHSVGIHSATHDYSKIYQSEKSFFNDLYKMQDIIAEKAGIRTTIMRFPGGSSNTVSRRYCKGIMSSLTESVTDQGFQYFDWNVLSGDAGETTSTKTVAQNVIDGVQKQDISIVLQHDTEGFSVDAVEKIIVWGLANGYTFLPLEPSSPTVHQHVNN